MKEKKSIIQRATILQNRIDKRLSKIKPLTIQEWFKFCTFIFMILGFMLFFFCILSGVNPFMVNMVSNPIQYICLGFVTMFIFLACKLANIN